MRKKEIHSSGCSKTWPKSPKKGWEEQPLSDSKLFSKLCRKSLKKHEEERDTFFKLQHIYVSKIIEKGWEEEPLFDSEPLLRKDKTRKRCTERHREREREIHFSVCKGLDTKIEFHTENLSAASTSLLAPVWFLRKLPCFFQTPTPTSNISVFSQLFHVNKLLCTIARIEGVV